MIKNLMFDLGGVIMDIRRENCVEAFRKLGMKSPEDYLSDYCQTGPFEAVENGSATAAEFRDQIRAIIGRDITDEQIDEAFTRFLIGIPVERLRALGRLCEQFNLYLLSNTNPVMWNRKIEHDFDADGHSICYYFRGILRSYDAKVMKPDPEIFLIAERQFGIKPDETIFLDDSEKNCRASEALGFKSIWVKPGTEFMELLKAYPGLDIR